MLTFFKPQLRVGVAEFDGPNWKAGDELRALRSLVDFRASNQARYYPVHLIEWSPQNKAIIAGIPPGTTHFADHDSKDAYHAMQLERKGNSMGCSKYKDSRGNDVYLEPRCYQQGQDLSVARFFPWFGMDTHALLAPITLYGGWTSLMILVLTAVVKLNARTDTQYL